MDEFQNYEKAFGALSESYKCLSKAKVKNVTEQEERLATLKTRLTVMKKFIQAKKYVILFLKMVIINYNSAKWC